MSVDPRTQPASVNPSSSASESGALAARPGAGASERIPGSLIGSIIAAATVSFLGLVLETVVNTLFPILMRDFGVSMNAVSWMTTGYLLVVTVIMPLSGYLQRRFTARALFITAAVILMVGSAMAALAPAYPVLLVGRLIQGIGTGISTPLMFSIIMIQAPRARVGMLMGIGSLILGVAPALGPTLGGVVSTLASWRIIFGACVPLLIVALIVGSRCIHQATETRRETLGVGQLVLMAAGLVSLVLGVKQIGAQMTGGTDAASLAVAIALPVLGLVCIALFVRIALRSQHPLIHLNVLRDGTYAWSLVAFACLQFMTLGLGYIVPTFAQLSLGYTALAAGFAVLPGAAVGAVGAPLGGSILDHVGARVPIMAGAGAVVVAIAAYALFGVQSGLVGMAIMNVVYMLGFGLCFASTQTHGMAHVPQYLTPDATAMMNACQQFAGALSMTVLSTIMAVGQSGAVVGTAGYAAGTRTGSAAGLGFMLVVAVFVLFAEALGLKKRK